MCKRSCLIVSRCKTSSFTPETIFANVHRKKKSGYIFCSVTVSHYYISYIIPYTTWKTKYYTVGAGLPRPQYKRDGKPVPCSIPSCTILPHCSPPVFGIGDICGDWLMVLVERFDSNVSRSHTQAEICICSVFRNSAGGTLSIRTPIPSLAISIFTFWAKPYMC